MDNDQKMRFFNELCNMVNTGDFSAYLSHVKIVLHSNKAGTVCKVEDARSNQLLNHGFKIVEKVVYCRVRACGMFETVDYQSGFKAGASCGTDQARFLL
jgi:hypothetical protein